jgi:hypothetical protein
LGGLLLQLAKNETSSKFQLINDIKCILKYGFVGANIAKPKRESTLDDIKL